MGTQISTKYKTVILILRADTPISFFCIDTCSDKWRIQIVTVSIYHMSVIRFD